MSNRKLASRIADRRFETDDDGDLGLFTDAEAYAPVVKAIATEAATSSAAVGYGEASGTAGSTSAIQGGGTSYSGISVARESYIARPNGLYNLGSMFQVNSALRSSPASLSVTFYDRENYAGAETHNFGTLYANNGATYRAGGYSIAFTLKNGQYVTANGLGLSDFTFSASTQENRIEHINVDAYAANGSLLGSRDVDVVTHATTVDANKGVATGAEIAKVAQTFIGKTWDASGCWVLASDIAATAGASLCLNSGWITSQVGNNGQFTVAYDAYNGVNANWMAGLQAGDMVELGWKNVNYGHIFTIDRVANGTAYLVDNSGAYTGTDPNDLLIAERAITQYAPSINQNTVVVYRANGLTPSVGNLGPTTLTTDFTDVTVGKSVAAASLIRTTDADNDAVTQYQFKDDQLGGGYFTVNGVRQAEGQWFTVGAAQLSSVAFNSSATGSYSDTFEARGYDNQNWGAVDTGRIVSLWDQTSQNDEKTFRTFGAVDKANYATKATEWVGATDKNDWWSFSISSAPTSVDIQLANMVGQANLYVFDSKGGLVGSAYGYAYNNRSCKLSGTLGVGTYTIRIDDYLGDTNYDLTVGKTGTVQTVATGGTTQAIYSGTALKPTSGGAPDASYFGNSLAYADSTGLGSMGASGEQLAAMADQQKDRMLLASV
jgi:hypothetical protein